MSLSTSGVRLPTLVVRGIDNETIGVRFQQIGSRQRFNVILQRFRAEFLLARCQELDNQAWWLIAASQSDALANFAQRYGLKLINTSGG